ncbi:MAG: hypothetical protein QOF51_2850 [Chloroflexota bacterium]|nr:hypothetical protein [Chloroflexota bacterium]
MSSLHMSMGHLATWRPWQRTAKPPQEPGAELFRGVHLRLTLWYSGVLALALIIGGLVLYFGLQDLTMTPVRESLRSQAEFLQDDWLRTPAHLCGDHGGRPPMPMPPRPTAALPTYIACFDASGQTLNSAAFAAGPAGTAPDGFLASPLVDRALKNGAADDVVEADDIGPIYRVARAVINPTTGATLGVVQVGQSIAAQTDALTVMRNLLLLLGLLAMAASVAGGLFLADRALDPARWAFARQRTFIADASHQLRTPLTLLRADAEVLLRHRDRLIPDDAELLDDIVAETEHMQKLATNLLVLARLSAERPHLEHEVFDLSTLAADLTHRTRPLAEEKGLSIEQDFRVRAELVGDRHAVEQAALILMDNAMKYTPTGGTIALRTEANDGKVSLVVQDTGIGIAADQIHRLGERFYRVDPARSHEGGAGLGLAIARSIAAAHGGTVQIASAPGRGTRAALVLASSLRAHATPT